MDIINNKGEKVGSQTVAISNDKSVMINRLNDVTVITTRDRNHRQGHDRDVFRGFAIRGLTSADWGFRRFGIG